MFSIVFDKSSSFLLLLSSKSPVFIPKRQVLSSATLGLKIESNVNGLSSSVTRGFSVCRTSSLCNCEVST